MDKKICKGKKIQNIKILKPKSKFILVNTNYLTFTLFINLFTFCVFHFVYFCGEKIVHK